MTVKHSKIVKQVVSLKPSVIDFDTHLGRSFVQSQNQI